MVVYLVRASFVFKIERTEFAITVWCVSAVLAALSCTYVCDMISPSALGSGIPQLKSILSGVDIHGYLLPKTLVAKILGLMLIQFAGFKMGLEGPIIHCSAIIANMVIKSRYFSEIGDNSFYRRQILTCSAASGIVSTWGTPYGGMIFSMECTSSIYIVSNLYKSFVCVMAGSYLYQSLQHYEIISRIPHGVMHAEFSDGVAHYIVFGIICGYCGVLVTFITVKVLEFHFSTKLVGFGK